MSEPAVRVTAPPLSVLPALELDELICPTEIDAAFPLILLPANAKTAPPLPTVEEVLIFPVEMPFGAIICKEPPFDVVLAVEMEPVVA